MVHVIIRHLENGADAQTLLLNYILNQNGISATAKTREAGEEEAGTDKA